MPAPVEVLVMDRLVVSLSPIVIGAGVEAVADLGIRRVTDGLRLTNRCTVVTGDDLLLGWDVQPPQ